MRKYKHLAVVATAVTVLVGTSAFADSRPTDRTRGRGEDGRIERRDGGHAGSTVDVERRRGDDSRNDREWRDGSRRENRDRDRDRDRGRGGDRGGDRRYDRNRDHSSYGNRQPYKMHGRVSRYERYRDGYRVWVGGAPYPFYVPSAYWRPSRFRVGVMVDIGGYYNQGGYYDYWDGYSRADFGGVVESVDYRRDSFVVRNDDTGNYITVVMRDDRQPFPRPGEYVEVRGDWTTRGYFRAYDVSILDGRRDRY